ncbi:MAG: hypothetical protein HGA47_01470 [Zoogloea sp.]|nr:hypothetical protein [Zoogloea sp.]
MPRLAILLLCAPFAAVAAGTDLLPGRLFNSPEERHRLEQAPPAPEPDEPQPASRTVRLDGIVLRSDGAVSIWINGRPHENASADDLHILPGAVPGSARIITRDRREFLLHVGESLLIAEPAR